VKLTGKLKRFIANATKSYGKVKLVLKHNRFWVETADMEVCQGLVVLWCKVLQDQVLLV
jgi:DNA excision repair protein ERCC-3